MNDKTEAQITAAIRALPDLDAPPHLWDAVRKRVDTEAGGAEGSTPSKFGNGSAVVESIGRRPVPRRSTALAMAASVFLAAIATVVLTTRGVEQTADVAGSTTAPSPTLSPTLGSEAAGMPGTSGAAALAGASSLQHHVERSQNLERTMREAPRIIMVESPTQRVLAQRIAALDADLNGLAVDDKEGREALWQQRVTLMESYWRLQRERDSMAFQKVAY